MEIPWKPQEIHGYTLSVFVDINSRTKLDLHNAILISIFPGHV